MVPLYTLQAMPLQLEAKKSADKKRYRQIRDSETTEQRDERNDKRRKEYMARVLLNTNEVSFS